MLTIVNTYGLRGLSFELFQRILKSAQKVLPQACRGEMILYLVGQKEIRKLNKTYRKLDQATDVLSFAYQNEEFGDKVLGEIYISVEIARKQASLLGHNLSQELAFLFSHGLLHIYGYEHSNNEQLALLEKIQNKILKKACISLEV